jgi:RNA polymerase sigma-70 factor, ECF subfamily
MESRFHLDEQGRVRSPFSLYLRCSAMPAPSPSDPTASFNRLKAGDHQAFDALYRAYHPSLCAFANSIVRDRTAGEDIVQDVFVTIWGNRKTLATPTTPRAYLYAAVRNRALNHVRNRSVGDAWQESERQDAETPRSTQPSADDDLDARELHEQLEAALNRLSPRSKIAATLRWYEQMTYAEIAEAMGISEKSVENQLSRAIKALRVILDPQ